MAWIFRWRWTILRFSLGNGWKRRINRLFFFIAKQMVDWFFRLPLLERMTLYWLAFIIQCIVYWFIFNYTIWTYSSIFDLYFSLFALIHILLLFFCCTKLIGFSFSLNLVGLIAILTMETLRRVALCAIFIIEID